MNSQSQLWTPARAGIDSISIAKSNRVVYLLRVTLLVAVGCRVIEGSGSSVTFEKNGMKVFFHRPHPQKQALRYRIKDAREFLNRIGFTP